MTEYEVIDWFMRWAAEYVALPRATWDRDKRIDANPRWRVFKLCVALCEFKPEDCTPEALTAVAATLKGKPSEDYPEWWPDADWAHDRLSAYARQGKDLGFKLWRSGWRNHRADRGSGRQRQDNKHVGTDITYEEAHSKAMRGLEAFDPPYHKLGIPKGI